MPKSVKRSRMVSTGLCGTCVNAPLCSFPRKAGVPVMQCNEFDGAMVAVARPSPAAAFDAPSAIPTRRAPGLCTWCDNNPSCTFPRATGGVWFCEEYR
jgi:hypothetical protein